MAATWATRLASTAEHRDLKLYVEVEGIPQAFIEQNASASTWTGIRTTQLRSIVSVEIGEVQLDVVRRRATGGSLTVRLQDDASNTLRALFVPRARRTTWLTASVSTSATSLSMNSGSVIDSADDTIYIGGETILGGDGGTSTFTVTTRGAYGSRAQAHLGGTENGTSIYVSPPTWVGRRVKLVGYFLQGDGVATTTTSLSETLGTYAIEEAPAYVGDGVWELRCGDVAEQISRTKVGKGLVPVPLNRPSKVGEQWVFFQTNGEHVLPVSSHESYLLRTEHPHGPTIVKYDERFSTTVYVSDVPSKFEAGSRREDGDWSGQLLCVLTGALPGEMMLWLLSSRLGTSVNGAYDVLPGVARASFGGEGLQMGAGITSSEIDSDAFLSVGGSGVPWSYIVDKEIPTEELLADFCLATDSYWFIDRDGLLTVRLMAESRITSPIAIDTSVVTSNATVEHDEENIFPRISLKCDYSPITREFLDTMTVVDEELQARYPRKEDALELSSRSLRVAPGFQRTNAAPLRNLPASTIDDVRMMLRRMMTGSGRGRMHVSATCTLEALQVYIGDTVTLTLDDAPDLEGSVISGARALVVGVRPNLDRGTVELRMQVQDTLSHIAPAAVVQSVPSGWTTGGLYRVDLLTTGYENVDANPANMFAVGWDVYLVATSARTDAYSGLPVAEGDVSALTVDVITTGVRLTFYDPGSFPGSFVPIPNDFVMAFEQTGAASTPLNTNGYARTDFAYQMADNLASVSFVTRWR